MVIVRSLVFTHGRLQIGVVGGFARNPQGACHHRYVGAAASVADGPALS
jgi:hypothetical protein